MSWAEATESKLAASAHPSEKGEGSSVPAPYLLLGQLRWESGHCFVILSEICSTVLLHPGQKAPADFTSSSRLASELESPFRQVFVSSTLSLIVVDWYY